MKKLFKRAFSAALLASSLHTGAASAQGIVAPPQTLYYVPGTWAQGQVFGTGTKLETGIYALQTAQDAALSSLGAISRRTMIGTTLTVTGTTTNIWEGLTVFTNIGGGGVANGEINNFHGQLTVASGTTVAATESYESKMTNSGTISGYHIGLWAIAENLATGTAVNYTGMKTGLINYNPAAGSVTSYIGWDHTAWVSSGGGTVPTTNILIKNADAGAHIGTLGQIAVGSLAAPGAGQMLRVTGTNTTGGTYSFAVVNSAATNLLLVGNDGELRVANNLFNVDSGGGVTGVVYKVGANVVVRARETGWTAMTGTANKATVYDTATVTLPQLAGRVLSIQAALTTHGLIGP